MIIKEFSSLQELAKYLGVVINSDDSKFNQYQLIIDTSKNELVSKLIEQEK